MFGRITFDPGILGGRASIRGMATAARRSSDRLLTVLAEEVLDDYPDLEAEDIGRRRSTRPGWLRKKWSRRRGLR